MKATVKQIDFVVMYHDTPYTVSLVEWAEGGYNALLNGDHIDSYGVTSVELEEEFDHSPTVQDILGRIDSYHEKQWDAWNERNS